MNDLKGLLTRCFLLLASRQERLGQEFEKAIFDDLDGLYEN